jgi:cell pole-organizing protein PopZ
MKPKFGLWVVWVMCWIGWGLAVSASAEEDPGYFLSMKQKGQLIWNGQIEDNKGNLYDVLIVPGYTHPARMGWDFLGDAGEAFSKYGDSSTYNDLAEGSSDCFKWAFRDSFYDFTLKGTGNAWGKYFDSARERTNRRVFGWWLAYPWAFMQSTLDNSLRIPAGLVGTAGGSAMGLVGVPTWYMTAPTAEASFCSVAGVGLPVMGWTWNTAIAPPMAFLGQKPAESRVDRFWVRLVNPSERNRVAVDQILANPDPEALDTLATFGSVLHRERARFDQQYQEIEQKAEQEKKPLKEETDRIRDEAHRKIQELSAKEKNIQDQAFAQKQKVLEEEKAHIQKVLSEPSQKDLMDSIRAGRVIKGPLFLYANGIRRTLMSKGFSEKDAEAIYNLIQYYIPDYPENNMGPSKKDDPLKESVRVIENVNPPELNSTKVPEPPNPPPLPFH